MIEQSAKRDYFFDSLKFFLIAVVIFGHVLEAGKCSRLEIALYNTIYSFHMPLFVFVSGFLTKKHDDIKAFLCKILRILETYIVFQLIFSLPVIFSGDVPVSIMIRPFWILWYLFSLIIWRVFIQFTPQSFLKNWKFVIFLSVFVSLLSGYVPLSDYFSFQRTMTFLPFFIIGYLCSNIKDFQIKRTLPTKIVAILYFILLFSVFYILDTSFSKILYGSSYYTNNIGLVSRFAQILLGCFGGYCFMGGVNGVKNLRVLSDIGSKTLFFYVYHAFFIILLKRVVNVYNYSLDIVSLIVIFILIFLLLYLLSHINLFRFFLNPISSIYDKKYFNNRRS